MFYCVYTLPSCGLTFLPCTHVHVIFIFKETKSCTDIDGSCMLMNLQSRREGVQSDKMISAVPHYSIKSVCIKTVMVAALINYNANIV